MRNGKWGSRALVAAVLSGMLGVAAHAEDKEQKKQHEQQMKEGKKTGEAAAKRQRYVGKLAVFNAKEIALAKLAAERAADTRVQEFARQIQRDHEMAQQEIKDWADNNDVKISSLDLSEEQQQGVGGAGMQEGYQRGMEDVGEKLGKGIDEARKDINDLKAKQGKDFDKAFLSRIARDQREGVDVLKDGRKEFKSDPTLLSLLNKTETVVANHESMAKQLEKEMK